MYTTSPSDAEIELSPPQIFSGLAHPILAQRICEKVEHGSVRGVPLGKASVRRFPDGETSVQIEENIRGRDIYIIQPTCNPANEHLMELLIMVDAARRASAGRITAVIPYFGYARQDRKDKSRVPITAKLVANMLTAAGVNRVLTIDLHAQQISGFFDIPVDNLFGSKLMIEELLRRGVEDVVVVSPDVGGVKMVYAYAQALNAGLAIVAKRRRSATETEAVTLIGEVEGKHVVLVDDMCGTGGTLAGATKLLWDRGAKSVIASVSHGVFSVESLKRLADAGLQELICTNSVPLIESSTLKVTEICISDLIARAISWIHKGKSLGPLFEIDGRFNVFYGHDR
jgi:ribose-phosphate pyrophosphokinase